MAASADSPDLRRRLAPAAHALAERGIAPSTRIWTDPDVRWHEFDLVLANGAWDNIHRPDEFLAWVDDGGGGDPLANCPAVLRWNLDKRYLAALSDAGVATVPTVWLTPARDAAGSGCREHPPASGRVRGQARRLGRRLRDGPLRGRDERRPRARAHVGRLLNAGRTVMVQPYQAAVDTHGETGLIFLGGRFSHAIGKGPLLRPGAGPQTHLYQEREDRRVHADRTQLRRPTPPWP